MYPNLADSKDPGLNHVKQIIWFASYSMAVSLLMLAALELAVRTLFPHVNYQGNQQSMFISNKFNQTMGLLPNASGEFFGKTITTDSYGFRQMATPASYDKSWLILGDSVTFGVGVETREIFPQLIQDEMNNTRIWNTAVVGYSTLDYLNITRDFSAKHSDIEKIILFYCLNDVYGNLSLSTQISAKEKILSYLRTNSKLYLLLKNIFFDRSKTYAMHDIKFYESIETSHNQHLDAIVKIKSIAEASNSEFLVVILPYEYQLRIKGLNSPQIMLKGFLQKHNIDFVDLYEDFSEHDSKGYYLYGDAMHLSRSGHRTVADKLISILK